MHTVARPIRRTSEAPPTRRLAWWDLAYLAGLAAMAVTVVVFTASTPSQTIAVLVILALLGLAYVIWGRASLLGTTNSPTFIVLLVAACGAGTFVVGDVASLQALAIPTVWWLGTPTIRRGIWLSAIITVVVLVCFVLGRGLTPSSIVTAVGFQTLSLSFSIAMGVWMRRTVSLGQERARLLDKLVGAQDELRWANREAGAAAERERLARDIHDTIAQELTGIVLLAQRAGNQLDRRHDDIADTVRLIETTARSALTEARTVVSINAPLPEGGLGEVLTRLASRFERESGVRVGVTLHAIEIPRALEVVLLRCAQEGLSNVRKHSSATNAWIAVSRDADRVRLTVDDDGVGPSESSDDSGFGLAGMQARAHAVGGVVTLAGRTTGGARLSVDLPLTTSEDPR